MDIEIIKTNPSKSILVESSLKWKLFIEKSKPIFLFQILLGTIFIIMGVIDDHGTYSNINIILSLGIAFILLAGIYIYQQQQNKRKFLDKARKYSRYLEEKGSEIKIHITDEIITYKDFQFSQEIHWSLFTHYRLYRNYLFLITDENFLSSIIINKTLFDEIEFIELVDFISQKLIEKK